MRDILRNIFWRGVISWGRNPRDISPLKKVFLNISRIKRCIITLLYRTSLKGIWIKNWNWVASTFIPKPYILQTNKMPVNQSNSSLMNTSPGQTNSSLVNNSPGPVFTKLNWSQVARTNSYPSTQALLSQWSLLFNPNISFMNTPQCHCELRGPTQH